MSPTAISRKWSPPKELIERGDFTQSSTRVSSSRKFLTPMATETAHVKKAGTALSPTMRWSRRGRPSRCATAGNKGGRTVAAVLELCCLRSPRGCRAWRALWIPNSRRFTSSERCSGPAVRSSGRFRVHCGTTPTDHALSVIGPPSQEPLRSPSTRLWTRCIRPTRRPVVRSRAKKVS